MTIKLEQSLVEFHFSRRILDKMKLNLELNSELSARKKRIHVLGICGRLTGSIAIIAKCNRTQLTIAKSLPSATNARIIPLIFREMGHTVTGCDWRAVPPVSTLLDKHSIDIIEGYHVDQLKETNPDLVIIGNNHKRGEEIVEYILKNGIPYMSAAQFIGEYFLRNRWVLAVAGTNGKTTTTGMLAWILRYAGLKPSFIVGGLNESLGEFCHFSPDSKYFVIEADEYKTAFFDAGPKFWHYRPKTVVMNNLEMDHASVYSNLNELEEAFHTLTQYVPNDGLLIYPKNSGSLQRVIERGVHTPQATFGRNGKWKARLLEDDGSEFEILFEEKVVGKVEWKSFGEHQVLNALAATAAAHHAGVDPSIAAEALCQFLGSKDRLTKIGSANGVSVWMDYAYHPAAIQATLQALRSRLGPKARIVAGVPAHNQLKWDSYYRNGLIQAVFPVDHAIIFAQPKSKYFAAFEGKIEEVPPMAETPVETSRDFDQYRDLLSKQALPGTNIVLFWTYTSGRENAENFLESLRRKDEEGEKVDENGNSINGNDAKGNYLTNIMSSSLIG